MTEVQRYREQLDKIIDEITAVELFPSLVWVWAWDVVREFHDENPDVKPYGDMQEYAFKSSLDEVFEDLYRNADKYGFTLEYGSEVMYDSIREWLIDNDHLVSIDQEELEEEVDGDSDLH